MGEDTRQGALGVGGDRERYDGRAQVFSQGRVRTGTKGVCEAAASAAAPRRGLLLVSLDGGGVDEGRRGSDPSKALGHTQTEAEPTCCCPDPATCSLLNTAVVPWRYVPCSAREPLSPSVEVILEGQFFAAGSER